MGREIDGVPGRSLGPVQLEGPGRIACVTIRYQIAQKLHACTEVFEDGEPNERFRDVIDVLLLGDLLDTSALPAVRAACEEIFALRAGQAWPPEVTVWPAWEAGFAALAREIGFHTEHVTTAVAALRDLIGEIADA